MRKSVWGGVWATALLNVSRWVLCTPGLRCHVTDYCILPTIGRCWRFQRESNNAEEVGRRWILELQMERDVCLGAILWSALLASQLHRHHSTLGASIQLWRLLSAPWTGHASLILGLLYLLLFWPTNLSVQALTWTPPFCYPYHSAEIKLPNVKYSRYFSLLSPFYFCHDHVTAWKPLLCCLSQKWEVAPLHHCSILCLE
jgi:hypothetical protein